MKATELRIGNYVDLGGGRNLYQIQDEIFGSLNLNPIPLTEEWLLKFGFEEIENLHTHWKSDKGFFLNGYIIFMEKIIGVIIGEKSNSKFYDHSYQYRNGIGIIKQIQYVHQLQNLYFALTGEELEIK
jgi:hypothetical protein